MKRSDRPLYIPPALRSNMSKKFKDEMEYAKEKNTNNTTNSQEYVLETHGYSQMKSAITFLRREQFHSSGSSFNLKKSSNGFEDYDSSNFEDCSCDFNPENDSKTDDEATEEEDDHFEKKERFAGLYQEIEIGNHQSNTKISNRVVTQHGYSDIKSHSNQGLDLESNEDHWEKDGRYQRTEIENHQSSTKISNKVATQHEDYSDVKSHSNQVLDSESIEDDYWEKDGRHQGTEMGNNQTITKISSRVATEHEDYSDVKSKSNQVLDSESNETKLGKELFDNYGDTSISDIEALTDSYTERKSVLTSTPNSDITDQKVLGAVKQAIEEENESESTLLDQIIHETTNINERDNNFIYRDNSSIKSEPTNYCEIFGGDYIPPPVPPTTTTFRFAPMYRLPSSISSPCQLFVTRQVSRYNLPQFYTQLRRPRQTLAPSLRPPYMPVMHRHVFLSRLKSTSVPHLNTQPIPYSIPPTLLPQVRISPQLPHPNTQRIPSPVPPTLLPQVRISPQQSLQEIVKPPYLGQRCGSPQNLESHKQEHSFFIPPPVSPAQLMNGSPQITNLNLRENLPSCPPYSSSSIKKMVFDAKT